MPRLKSPCPLDGHPRSFVRSGSNHRVSGSITLTLTGTLPDKVAPTTTGGAGIDYGEMGGRFIDVDVLLLTYVTEVDGRWARRGSLWRRQEARGWQLVRYQGTPVP